MLCLRASRQLFCRPLLSKRHFASRHSFLVAAFHSSKRSLGRHDGQKDKAKNDWKKMVQVSKAILAINTAVLFFFLNGFPAGFFLTAETLNALVKLRRCD